MRIYHSTPIELVSGFHSKPTWFSLSTYDAIGWHNSTAVSEGQITYVCEFEGKIATKDDSRRLAKVIWPDDDLIYSMYDVKVGEFKKDEIESFFKLLKDNGFDAAEIEDYDPRDFGNGKSTTTLCVFNGANVKIVDVLRDTLLF